MTDLTPIFSSLLTKQGAPLHKPHPTPDEFLKEAYRINSHITSLLQYLHSIRHSYLSTTKQHPTHNATPTQHLTDPERDAVDTSTALLLRDLATSIANLSSAESLRQETTTTLLHKKYGHSAAAAALRRWAGDSDSKSPDQLRAEETARTTATVREAVLWFLRHGLEGAAGAQRGMVEKRIERVREKEKSVLYKAAGKRKTSVSVSRGVRMDAPGAAVMSESDTALIEAELSQEQLQIFAEENNSMLKHYEDTLGQVQNAERSLLDISSLQETLVTHLASQEEHIFHLVSDVEMTETNVGRGNRELKRATGRRSTAQAVFWGTVGLCTWLVVWDLVF